MSAAVLPAVAALVPVDDVEALDPWSSVAFARECAQRFGTRVIALLAGADPDEAMAHRAFDAGADEVWLVAHGPVEVPAETDRLVATFERALVQPQVLRGRPERGLFVLPAGVVGEEIAARLAARFDGTPLGRCLSIEPCTGGVCTRRTAYGGRAQVTIEAVEGPFFAAVRNADTPQAAAVHTRGRAHGALHRLEVDLPPEAAGFVQRSAPVDANIPLEGARVVVAGGRGMRGPEGFAALRAVAHCLQGALGGSLPTVDAGWTPVTHQIGQSGKYIAPELYVAVGISGTPQHMAGVAARTRIVAINEDPEADIFRVADIGVIGDWQTVLPALLARLRGQVAQ